jgi:hypothetical protein
LSGRVDVQQVIYLLAVITKSSVAVVRATATQFQVKSEDCGDERPNHVVRARRVLLNAMPEPRDERRMTSVAFETFELQENVVGVAQCHAKETFVESGAVGSQFGEKPITPSIATTRSWPSWLSLR